MNSDPILSFRNIVKRFPGVEALKGVDLDLNAGEVHVLVGANGAGKSTLVKILAGVYHPDEGEIYYEGRPASIRSPEQALESGISVVYQNFNLINKMNVGQNIFLNREPVKGRFFKRIDWKRLYSDAAAVLQRLHMDLDPKVKVGALTVADHQMIEIAKALSIECRILVLDEPTSSLSEQETEELFSRISKLREDGVAILYISHRMEEIKRIGDRVTVFRDGRKIGTEDAREITVDQIIKMMLGREIDKIYPWIGRPAGEELLSVEGLSSPGILRDVSFTLHRGEILGLAGLVGAKRTEVAHAIFGALPLESGRIILNGRHLEPKTPRDAINAGIGLLPEDKRKHGMFSILSVSKNITSAGLRKLKTGLALSLKREREVSEDFVKKLNIRAPSVNTRMESLSGGNQQKVVLTKCLFTNSEVLIFDEPTKGIDVGAKEDIYRLMIELAQEGKGIIMISSDIPEVLGMSDRIMVMKEGRITAEMFRDEANQQKILGAAL